MPEWYTPVVPTTRERIQVTVSDELAVALDDLAREHPREARAQLVARLALLGARARGQSAVEDRLRRVAALWELSHDFADCFPPGYLGELRRDWEARP